MYRTGALAWLLLTLRVWGAGLPVRSKPAVYLQGARPASRAESAAELDGFVRTYLQLRLLETGKVVTPRESEPPCQIPGPPQGLSGYAAPDADSAQGSQVYFRTVWSIQPRYDSAGNTLDIAFTYDLFKVAKCDPTNIGHGSRTFSTPSALGEIRAAAEAIANTVKSEVTEKLRVWVAAPMMRDPKNGGAAFQRAVNYALSDADGDYQFITDAPQAKADYTVESEVRLTAPKKGGDGAAFFSITVRGGKGQSQTLAPMTFSYHGDGDLPAIYFDAGNTIVSAISEIHNREMARGDPSELAVAVRTRQVSALLCRGQDSAKDCEAQPGVALAVLDSLPADQARRAEVEELRGVALSASRRYETAGQQFDLAVAGTPESDVSGKVRLLHLAGSMWYAAGAYDKALERYLQDLRLRQARQHKLPAAEGPQANEYVDLLRVYAKLNRFDDAIRMWSEAASNGGSTAELEAELGPILGGLNGEVLEKGVSTILGMPGISRGLVRDLHARLGAYFSEKKDYARAGAEYAGEFEAVRSLPDHQASEVAIAANKAGLAFESAPELEDALQWHQTARDWGKQAWEAHDQNNAILVTNVARLYVKLAKYKDAEAEVAPVVTDLENDKAQTDSFASALDVLASALAGQLRFADARKQYDRLADLQLRVHGPASVGYASAVYAIGRMYDRALQFKEAEAAYAKALPVITAAYGKDSDNLAALLNNMGVVRYNQGDYQGALTYYLKTLPIYAALGGSSWADEAMSRFNIADLYTVMEKLPEAEAYVRQGLKIVREEHHDAYRTAVGLNRLAAVRQDNGQYQEAAELYGQSIESFRTGDPQNRWYVATSFEDLATNERERGEFSQAESQLAQADSQITGRWGAGHSRRGVIFRERAMIAVYRKQFADAVNLIAEADRLLRTRDDDAVRGLEWERAQLGLAQGDLAAAEEQARAYFQFRNDEDHNDPVLTLDARILLAKVLAKKGDSGEARKLIANGEPFQWPPIPETGVLWAHATHAWALAESAPPTSREKASSLFQNAEKLYRKILGDNSPFLVELLRDEAGFLAAAGNSAGASAKIRQAEAAEKSWN